MINISFKKPELEKIYHSEVIEGDFLVFRNSQGDYKDVHLICYNSKIEKFHLQSVSGKRSSTTEYDSIENLLANSKKYNIIKGKDVQLEIPLNLVKEVSFVPF